MNPPLIQPVLKGDELLADIRSANPRGGLVAWWLGQSGFLVKADAGFLLLDPYLSDSLTEKYAATNKPHVRMTAIPIEPRRLDFIDVVTSSHLHTDHLDAATLRPLIAANPNLRMVIPEANRAVVVERLACPADWPLGLNDRQSLTIGGFEFHGIAAAHDAVDRDPAGRCRYLGYVVRCGNVCLYHSGDTLWHADLVEQLSAFEIDVAFLPINGRLPRRRVAGNLWGQEAVALAHDIRARLVLPCHFEMFTFNTEPPDAFLAKCRELNQPHALLRCGQRLEIPAR